MSSLKSCGINFFLFASLIMFACNGGGGGGDSSSSIGAVGTVSMSLTDAMSNRFNAVYVTIDDVQVHMKGNGKANNSWQSVSAPNLPKTFNLYHLTNGVRVDLGLADLAIGSYTQMRLIIGTDPDGYFAIFVSPLEDGAEYNLVIYTDGKAPAYKKITNLIAGETLTFPDDDIQLGMGIASTKNVEGTVTITGGDNNEQLASISFRQDITGGDMIEITSVDVLNTEVYDIDLPVESYSEVAWTLGFATQISDLAILETDTPPIATDISFP